MANELYEGATEPVWFGDRKVWSVTGFVLGVRSRITDLPSFWVQGEISDLRHQKQNSMVYLTLKDPQNGHVLKCTIGRTRFEQLGIKLRDGDKVHVYGRPDIYAPQGAFQMRAQSIEHTGRGMLIEQLEALKAKLADEGLFDDSRKRPLPFMPRRVGLITGADAAAQGDFLRNISERFPPVRIVMVETLVQGDRAAPLLVAALRKLQAIEDVDVIVITRGGGAFEHFLPFCDERLCRAIAACPKPVVSAIGHERDNPLSDYVADLRESTPTAAARAVVPDYAALVGGLERSLLAMRRRGIDRHGRRAGEVAALRARLSGRSPVHVVRDRKHFVGQLGARCRTRAVALVVARREALARDRRDLRRCIAAMLSARAGHHRAAVEMLRALSPLATLDRGYAIVRRDSDGSIVRDVADIARGDRVTMRVARGTARATVDEVDAGVPAGTGSVSRGGNEGA